MLMKDLSQEAYSIAYDLLCWMKDHSSPPSNKDDPYLLKKPWPSFGGVSSGICEAWCWFRDDVIKSRATVEDIALAVEAFLKEDRRISEFNLHACDEAGAALRLLKSLASAPP